MIKFLLDGKNSSLAFQKVQDFADWDNSAYTADAISEGWNADPANYSEDRVLDVSSIPEAIIAFKPSDSGATYNFEIRVGTKSANIENEWFTPDGGDYEGESGNRLVGVLCGGIDYLSIVADSVSAGTLEIELAPIPYETTE